MEENYNYESPNNYHHNTSNQSPGRRPYNGQSGNRQFRGFVPQNRGQRPQYSQCQFQNYRYQRSAPQQNCTQYGSTRKPYFQGNQVNAYRSRGWGQDPQHFRGRARSRQNFQNNPCTYQYQYYTHDPQSEQYSPPCSLCGGFNHSPKHCYKGNMISITLWKR